MLLGYYYYSVTFFNITLPHVRSNEKFQFKQAKLNAAPFKPAVNTLPRMHVTEILETVNESDSK